MKINKFKIVNFRNHSMTDLDMSKKINLFIGPNASGKSSIVDALAFMFTGRNSRTAKSGEGMNELLTFGESRSIVETEIKGIGNVTRMIPHAFQVANWEGTMTAQMELLYKQLGCTEEALLCTIYSSYFLDMPSADQKNFMFDLVGMKLNNDTVKKEFLEWCLSNNIERPENIWEYIANNVNFENNPAEFDRIHDYYFDLRKGIKKDIKNLESLLKDVKSPLPEGVTVEQREVVIEKLEGLKKDRDVLLVKIGNAKSIAKLRQTYTDKIAKEKDIVIPKETKVELEKKLEEYRNLCTENSKKISKLETQKNDIQDTINKLTRFDGKCPLSDKILCKMIPEEIEELIKKFYAQNEVIIKEMSLIEKTKEKLEKDGIDLRKLLDQRVQADILIPEIKVAKEELAKLGDIPDTEQMNKDVQMLNGRLTKGQSILTMIETEKYNQKSKIEAKNSLEKKKTQLEFIDLITTIFGSKGLKSTMLNKAMKPIETKINENMKILTDGKYSINFRIDENDYNIYVISDGIERRIKHLSSSEKMRIGVIMQDAISDLAGIKFMVVDNGDMLDNVNKRLFWNLIGKMKEKYDTIIILSTGTEIKGNVGDDVNTYLLGKRSVKNELF